MAHNGQQSFPAIIRRDEIMVATIRQIEETRKLVEYMTTSFDVSAASFKTIVRPLIELENAQSGERAVIAGLKYFSPSLKCQRVVSEAEDMWRKFETSVNIDLHALLDAVRSKNEDLCAESRKLLNRILLEYEESGYGQLDEAGLQGVSTRKRQTERL
jgi:metallopeptidase MepB